MNSVSIPLTIGPSTRVQPNEYLFEYHDLHMMRCERLFLHPQWAMQLDVQIMINHRFCITQEPGWCFTAFTVADTPLREWAEKMADVLYQKERAELANFLKGAISSRQGKLSPTFLMMPGISMEILLRTNGKTVLPTGPIGVLLGTKLSPHELLEQVADASQWERDWLYSSGGLIKRRYE